MTTAFAPDGVASVAGRIATIEGRIQSLVPFSAPAAPRLTGSDGAATTSGSRFAAVLGDTVSAATKSRPADSVGLTTVPTAAEVTGDDLVASARKYLGVPYVWGGTSTDGLDCSGLVQLAARDLGIDLPRVSRDQATVGTDVPSLAEARPGDLIAFGSPVDHIAIYVGNNQILEAPQPGQNVHVGPIHRTPTAIRRIVAPGDDVAASGAAAIAAPGEFSATRLAPRDGTGTSTAGAVGEATSLAAAMGIPPSLLAKFDPSQLADVPRAIPLAAMGMTTVDAARAATFAVDAANLPTGGFSAAQLSAAGISEATAAFAADFAAAEQQYHLPAGLLAAVAQAESGGRTDAVSPAGAQGLMQLMPGTAAALGVTDPFDPAQAIRGAAQYLSENLTAFGGALDKALAAYNAGPGAVTSYGGVPPYAETQNYVASITQTLARLT